MKINYRAFGHNSDRFGVGFAKNLLFGLFRFFYRAYLSVSLMDKIEKRIVFCLLLLSFILSGIKINQSYVSKTNLAAAAGGEYREGIIGEPKYLNPILAQSDADKSVAKLIFSGLVKINNDGVYPDLAERWEISPDGLRYTFYLRKDVLFQDGARFTANDVAFTLQAIKDTANNQVKSPLFDTWKDVEVIADNDYQVTFELSRPFGPFLYDAGFGIIPSHLAADEFMRKFIGTGPFKYKEKKTGKDKIELALLKNDKYYDSQPFLNSLKLVFFQNADLAKESIEKKEIDAIFGFPEADKGDFSDATFQSARRLGFIFNLRDDKFKDKEVRRKILEDETMEQPFSMRLVTLNSPLLQSQAEILKERFAKQNIKLDLISLNPIQLQDVVNSREFETLLYGFNFGYDRDPYIFWHTSQLDKLNFSGYSEKTSDILLEDARMITNPAERNAKYDLFSQTLKNESLALFFEPINYNYYISPKVKGVKKISGVEANSRYDNIAEWYIKEKRVRK